MRANYAITLGRERNCVSGVDSIAECWAGWGCLNSLVVWLMDVRRAAPQLTTSLASPWPVRVKIVTKQAAVSILMDGATAPSPARPGLTQRAGHRGGRGGQHCTFPWEMLWTKLRTPSTLFVSSANWHSSLLHALWAGQPGSGALMETNGER